MTVSAGAFSALAGLPIIGGAVVAGVDFGAGAAIVISTAFSGAGAVAAIVPAASVSCS
jgi:hypothetical protein